MKNIEELEALFDKYKTKKEVCNILQISRPTLDRWLKIVNFQPQKKYKTIQKKQKNNPKNPPILKDKKNLDILFTIEKDEGIIILKQHLEKIMNKQIKKYGEASSAVEKLYNRIWGEKLREHKIVVDVLNYFVDALQEKTYKDNKN